MTKLLRDDVLIAEGKASVDLEDGIALFAVKTWRVTDVSAHPWATEATWILEDGKRRHVLVGKAQVIGVAPDGVTLVTLDLDCSSDAGPLVIDVRAGSDA